LGKDNGKFLATPGRPTSKPETVNQDLYTESVRGQAFLDWMSQIGR
jgi:hypothetical protein